MAEKENVANGRQVKNSEFHLLFPDAPEMRIPASREMREAFFARGKRPYYLFAVPREYPVTDFKNIPEILLQEAFRFTANPGEFFVFQLVVWTPEEWLGDLRLEAESVPFSWRCFNLRSGRRLNQPSHSVRPLWAGVEIPRSASGEHRLTFRVETENFPPQTIALSLHVEGAVLDDGGESDDRRLARLRWLDSEIGKEDTVFPPYLPIRRDGLTLSWLGHTLELGENGLPRRITSSFRDDNSFCDGPALDLLGASAVFGTRSGAVFQGELAFRSEKETEVRWEVRGTLGKLPARLNGSLEFDGTMRFSFLVSLPEDGADSFQLELRHLQKDYFLGLDRHGGPCPERLDWYWDRSRWQDGYWIGSLNGGMQVRLSDPGAREPLVNAYYSFSPLTPPPAWENGGRGGIRLAREEGMVSAILFSGETPLRKNHELHFPFEFRITPFHPAGRERFFRERFYHPMIHGFEIGGADPLEALDFASLRREGITCVNLHHGIAMNPCINYPFLNVSLPKLASFVERAHRNGLKVLCYYTIRELSVHAPEFWAFRSMEDEIFYPGPGETARPCTNPAGPHPWLCERLGRDFLPAWAEVVKNGELAGTLDLALLTTPGGRLENFYLEGLRYLLERCPLDGLYLDDSSLSAEGFRRVHRIFRKYRKCDPILDFHAWNPFPFHRKRDFGNCSVVYRDMAKLPYMTDLWLGESFDYEAAFPEYYLTEISGLPFGLTGEMLRGGGNPWRGILFGMTSRYGWSGDPRSLWRFFDTFGLEGLRIESDFDTPSLRQSDPRIRAARFTNARGNMLLALASWHPETTDVVLEEDWTAPGIPGFQEAADYPAGTPVPLEPGKGVILQPSGRTGK